MSEHAGHFSSDLFRVAIAFRLGVGATALTWTDVGDVITELARLRTAGWDLDDDATWEEVDRSLPRPLERDRILRAYDFSAIERLLKEIKALQEEREKAKTR